MSGTGRPEERMSPLDSAFWHLEDASTSLHIGSVAVFEGPAPTQEEIRAAIARKLPLIPRYRQRMRRVPLDLGRPVWVDHAAFDLDQHLHRLSLPAPGGEAELSSLVGDLMSQRLDQDLPLWQDWVVEGLTDGRWALVTKVHHSMVDGIAGTDLLSTMLDHAPRPDPVPADAWSPASEPGAVGLVRDALADRARVVRAELRGTLRRAATPRATAGLLRTTARGLSGYATALWPFSGSSIAGPIGPQRRFLWTEVTLDDVLEVRRGLGGTVNDIVLAAVAGGFRALLESRGERPGPHTVRTLVPVSVRRDDQRGRLDNRVSAIVAELPVETADAPERLRRMSDRMQRLKASHEAETGELLTELADLLPPPLLAASLHLVFRVPHRVLTTVVTNVPGPRSELFLCGRPMLASYPYVPIADRVRIGVAVTSYEGRLLFGITCDAATTPDAEVLVDGLSDAFAELLAAARND